MICSVRRLDTASHAVRLLDGWLADGMMNGNIDPPAVRMIPTTASPLATSVRSGKRVYDGVAGENSFPFSGRIGKKKLKPGRYRATLTAKDPAGHVSKPKRLSFRIVE